MIGAIIPFAGNELPKGYLVCNGAAVSRNDYSDLFSIIGTTYGAGDGSTTFNLPDLTEKVGLGISLAHAIGSTGGSSTSILSETSTPLHSHTIPQHGHANDLVAAVPSLSHSITQPVFKYTRVGGSQGDRTGSGRNPYTGTGSASMSRATSLGVSNHAPTACTVTGGVQECSALTLSTTGEGASHNNMMPYLALVYIIQTIPDTPPTPPAPSMIIYNGCMAVTQGGYYLVGKK